AKVENRTSRARLKRGRQAHWREINGPSGAIKRVPLGYQRWPEDKNGRWILRRYLGQGKYTIQPFGIADDSQRSDGERVLSFDQAHARAIAQLDASKGKEDLMTVRQAFERYVG